MSGHAANRTCPPSRVNNNPLQDSIPSSSSPQKDTRHRHTQSLGLLSPIPSYAVLPRSPIPIRPCTPRPSPLRILHPLTPLASHLDMATTHSLTQPPSPTTPHHRPSSRSERLLRDTLKRDEQNPSHRRRHSVTTSPPPAGEDPYARGAHLFRTSVNAPHRAASPSPSRHAFINNHDVVSRYYGSGGDVSPRYHRGIPGSPARSSSPSPSSGRRNQSCHRSPKLAPPAGDSPVHGGAAMSRHQSVSQPGRPRGGQGKHRPPAVVVPRPGEPMSMTPHEQVLRARLEKVLTAGRIVSETIPRREKEKDKDNKERRRRSNEVRDEVDGWPWKERDSGIESPSLVSTPPHSSSSGSLSNSQHQHQHIQFQTHLRSRSKTDPTPPPTTLPPSISPRRGSTQPTLTTPSRARSKYTQSREREQDPRLLTPPPTPPSSSPMFQFQEYSPSPYKTRTLTPRRPTHAPITPGDDTCSTSSSSSLASLPPYDPPATPQERPLQFNARKASARCRAIEGYVSFASVEGLGEPAAVDDDVDEDVEAEERRGRGGGVFVGALRRLLGGSNVTEERERRGRGVVV